MSDRYCDYCGVANRPQARFCINCGQAMDNVTSSVTGMLPTDSLLNGRYRILNPLGEGGMAAVYKAEDTRLSNRPIAVKEMRQKGLDPHEIVEASEAFRREAHMLAGLFHRNLPRIYDHFAEVGRWYLVMDFIKGETLEDYLHKAGGKLSVKEVLCIGIQLCRVLSYLHNQQPPIIFRDLKPTNVMHTSDGEIFLIDFGIARHFKHGQAKDTIAYGSAGYAAPEQHGKAQTTPRSDIYALGATLHQLLSGSDPSNNPFHFAPLSGSSIPVELRTLLAQMLEIDENKRPSSMVEVKQKLECITDELQKPVPSPQPKSASIGTALYTYKKHSDAIKAVAWSADSKRVASASADGTVQVWNVNNGGNVVTYTGHSGSVNTIVWSPNGKQIASGGSDKTVDIWNAITGRHTSTFTRHSGLVNTVVWSPDGKYIASGGSDEIVYVWEVTTKRVVVTYKNHAGLLGLGWVRAVAWSPDGKHIASSGDDKVVRVWKSMSGDAVRSYNGHSSVWGVYIHALAWSPDGKYIASVSEDKTVRIWNALITKTLFTWTHTGKVNTVAWSPDGTRIATGSDDNEADVWDTTKDGDHTYTYKGHTGKVNTVAWSPDGTRIATGSDDKTVQVWKAK